MRSPSVKRLVETFKITSEAARMIKSLAAAADDPTELRALIEKCPATAAYVRQMYSSPYSSWMWRKTVVLHAIDDLLNGNGVDALGEVWDGTAPEYEYINMGDPHVPTLVYKTETDNLYIAAWGDIAERL